jgi:hypothetical protein
MKAGLGLGLMALGLSCGIWRGSPSVDAGCNGGIPRYRKTASQQSGGDRGQRRPETPDGYAVSCGGQACYCFEPGRSGSAVVTSVDLRPGGSASGSQHPRERTGGRRSRQCGRGQAPIRLSWSKVTWSTYQTASRGAWAARSARTARLQWIRQGAVVSIPLAGVDRDRLCGIRPGAARLRDE